MNGLPKVMQRSGLDLHLTPVCPAEGTETYNKNIKKKSMAIDLELATLLARRHYSSSHPLGVAQEGSASYTTQSIYGEG